MHYNKDTRYCHSVKRTYSIDKPSKQANIHDIQSIPAFPICAMVCISTNTTIANAVILWKRMCWSRGRTVASLVMRTKVMHFLNIRTRIHTQSKFKARPAPRANWKTNNNNSSCLDSFLFSNVKQYEQSKWMKWLYVSDTCTCINRG